MKTTMNRISSKLVFAILTGGFLFSLESTAKADCSSWSPGPGEVCLFVDAGWSGYSKAVSAQTIWWHLTGDNWGNDTLSSFLLGNNTELYLCSGWGFGEGGCVSYHRDDSAGIDDSQYELLSNEPNAPYSGSCVPPWRTTGMCNDWTSSIRVSPYYYGASPCLSPGPTECSFFIDWPASNDTECVKLSYGDYDWGAFGLPNDSISALKCGAYAGAKLWDAGGFAGSPSNYSGGGSSGLYVGYMNDKTSSLRVCDLRLGHPYSCR